MRRQAFLILLALAPLLCVPARAQQAKLDTTQFIVVGEGLAAGFADFALRDVYQDKSFGAQMARYFPRCAQSLRISFQCKRNSVQ